MTYTSRLRIAHGIKARLPWASVVCGARHYSFITIDRGETISYSGSDVRKSWSGSYPPIGSREVHVLFGQELVQVLENIYPSEFETQRCKEVWNHAIHPRQWQRRDGIKNAVNELVTVCESWLRPVDQARLVLPDGHKLVHRIHPLEPLMTLVDVRKVVKP